MRLRIGGGAGVSNPKGREPEAPHGISLTREGVEAGHGGVHGEFDSRRPAEPKGEEDMMEKATHSGTCQWCGHGQKLPSGRLAKHGYTVKWGFFNGTCKGSEELPFEVSCDLVKKSIEWAQAEKQGYVNECVKVRASTSTTLQVRWFGSLLPGNRFKEHHWIIVGLQSEHHERDEYEWTEFFYMDPEGRKQRAVQSYEGAKTMEQAVAKLNETRAIDYERTIKQIEEYITYQTARVANWKPAPLKEIKT